MADHDDDDELFIVDKTGDVAMAAGSGVSLISREEERLTQTLFGAVGALDSTHEGGVGEAGADEPAKRPRQAVWHDSDEEDEEVVDAKRGRSEKMLRDEYVKQGARPGWAQKAETDAANVMLSTAAVTAGGAGAGAPLEEGILRVQKLANLNSEARSDAPVASVEFSSRSLLALTAGMDKTLRLFQVGERKCAKVHSLFFPDLPMKKAFFVPGASEEVLCLSTRRKFAYYDLESDSITRVPYLNRRVEESWSNAVCSPDGKMTAFLGGKAASIVLFANESRMIAHTLSQGSPVDYASWSPDGQYLWTSGEEGFVYKWDVRNSRRCVSRFRDHGSIGTTALANSPDGRWQAVGDRSGMVNIYDLNSPQAEHGEPSKTLGNLVTAATLLRWSPNSQMLAMASDKMPHALRLAHVPSFTVFKNWPLDSARLHVVQSASFSPNAGYFAVGNRTGEAVLHRMLSFPTF